MRAIEVWINGEKKFMAGVENGVFSAILDYSIERASLRVGGLTKRDEGSFHIDWGRQELQEGDEVLLRVTRADQVDAHQNEKPQRTQAEYDAQVRDRLMAARALLNEVGAEVPPLFEQRLEENNFVGAMHILGEVGEKGGAGAQVWEELGWAAHNLGRHGDSRAYDQLKRHASHAEESTPQ